MSAATLVAKTLAAALPPGVPPSHRKILAARFLDPARVTATLEMFDGLPATLELSRLAYGWSIRYRLLPGGAIVWTGTAWKRD